MPKRWGRYALWLIPVWLVVVGALLFTGYGAAKQGRNELLLARAHFTDADLRSGTTQRRLLGATHHLHQAHDRLANPLVQPFRLIPVLGRQLSSAIALTNAAATASQVGADALSQGNLAVVSSKADRVQLLGRLATITSQADQRLARLHYGPSQALFSPLAKAHDELLADVANLRTSLRRADAAATGAQRLFQGPATYLVFAANNGEMRAGSGMFLSAGTLQANNGSLRLTDMRTVGELTVPPKAVKLPPDMQNLWGWLAPNTDFRNLMLSPRFDAFAPVAAQMWQAAGHGHVDGVLVLDPETLSAMLAATGPVQANGKQVSSATVVQQLLLDQYRTATNQKTRREGLSDVASAVFSSLDQGNWDPLVLAKGLGKAAQGRHLLLWAADPTANQDWQAAGVGGALSADDLALNIVNLGGNKLDQFLTVHSRLDVVTGASGLDMAVTVDVQNHAPTDAPGYVLGPFPGSGLKAGEYKGLTAFDLPGDSTHVRFDGTPEVLANGADGANYTIAATIDLKPGETKTMVVRFTRPATAQQTRVVPSARIPAISWRSGGSGSGSGDQWVDDHIHVLHH